MVRQPLSEDGALHVEVAPPASSSASRDVLTALVNGVYAVAEAGMWHPGASRTNVSEIAGLIDAGHLLVARSYGTTVGCVQVRSTDDGAGEFSMLAVDPRHRGRGVGRALVAAAETRCAALGCPVMRLELLVPRDREQLSKTFLRDWYTRIGYAMVRIGSIEDDHPDLGPWLAEPCDYLVYEKPLGSPSGR